MAVVIPGQQQPNLAYTWVPDFLFPPKHVQDQVAKLRSNPKPRDSPSCLPVFALKQTPAAQGKYLKLDDRMEVLPRRPATNTTTTTILPEITKSTCSSTTTPSPPTSSLSFLKFPVEIRLQIYNYILQEQPIQHPHLSPIPGSDDEACAAYTNPTSWPQGLSYLIHLSSRSLCSAAAQSPHIHHQNSHPAGKIPTALLQTCHQIYDEARIVPFQGNLFAFVNWFSSGIFAACRFTRALKPWQARGLRSVALDVLGLDLVYDEQNGKTNEGWIELCQMWSGVWTLHLKIQGRVTAKESDNDSTQTTTISPTISKGCVFDLNSNWIVHGLGLMNNLKRIELSIETQSVSEEVKRDFCEALGEKLTSMRRSANSGDEGREITVLYVEDKTETLEVKEVKTEFGWDELRSTETHEHDERNI
ncbi:hypothetical protein B7463_g10745, partial [Scytalidium lignicola]